MSAMFLPVSKTVLGDYHTREAVEAKTSLLAVERDPSTKREGVPVGFFWSILPSFCPVLTLPGTLTGSLLSPKTMGFVMVKY